MQFKPYMARLELYHLTIMSICREGKCIGHIISPAGIFWGQIIQNPLAGKDFKPDSLWFVVSQESKSFKALRKLVAEALLKDGKNIWRIKGLKVGLPKSFIGRSEKLEEFKEYEAKNSLWNRYVQKALAYLI